jgi:hypothetical protein
MCSSKHVSNINPNNFFRDLCDGVVSAKIPFLALKNETLKMFLEVNCGRFIPNESTHMNNYLSKCYNNMLEMIRNKVHGEIFFAIDETCDTEVRYEANVIVGTLEIDVPGEVFLLTSDVLKSVNHSTICKFFDRSVFLLWPEGTQHDDVLPTALSILKNLLLVIWYTSSMLPLCLQTWEGVSPST